MSYAIIRNAKYKKENLKGIFRHNERRNKNYSNKNIDKELSYLNYSIKECKYTYEKEFDLIKEKYNLKGQIKTVSNIVCEYIITSDKDFFNSIGEKETKRYFQTAYKFVCEYKDLGEQYILSAKVHMDEESPHMHLIFLPVIHTTDKKGNSIDKIACSEFWKAQDSYRQLQDAFYKYMIKNNFELERGQPKEETKRDHLSIEEYKKITNFEKTKETLKNIKLELPDVPDLKDIRKIQINRDEKILEEIIKPKDELITELYQDNLLLHQELSRQSQVINEAKKYQNERNSIIANNKDLNKKINDLELEFKIKENDIRYEYQSEIRKLEKENNRLNKIIDKFYATVDKFIIWICKKFGLGESKELIKNFQEETRTFVDPVKQLEHEEREKVWHLER